MPVKILVARETAEGERRVALVPGLVKKLQQLDAQVFVESGAGEAAGIPDHLYQEAGAEVVQTLPAADANILLRVQAPAQDAIDTLPEGAVVVGLLSPHQHPDRIAHLRDRKLTAFAMELVPRISRAQSMDVLSSQASVAGYRAVLIAAQHLQRFFPMLTTAAGTIRPAKVLIIGVGVAGLQAIATARRLGAIVEGYDVRAATREQVESLGARFVDTGVSAEGEGGYARELTDDEKAQQQNVLAQHIALADVVITTAAIPGRAAPRIISRAMVEAMKPGAVIVDLAAESGGNCELTKAGETVLEGSVQIVGPVAIPSSLAEHASEMYARNLVSFISPLLNEGKVAIDWEDEIYATSVLTHAGEVRHAPTRELIEKSNG